ncbi:MAG: hypothetical protein P8168_09330 [Deltaproteobacteria bacterium]
MFLKMLLVAVAATLCCSCASQDNLKDNVYRGLYNGLTAQYPDKDTQAMGERSHQSFRQPVSYDQYHTERNRLLHETDQRQK